MLINKFEEQVKRNPQAMAIKTLADEFTYGALNHYANRIAHAIQITFASSSTRRNTGTIGLLFDHGAHMIAALLGVLKAGLVYVPLAPDYPPNRLSYMLKNAETSLILTDRANEAKAKNAAIENNIPYITISEIGEEATVADSARDLDGNKVAYIIYTSGSTGLPKGVPQTHKNIYYYIRNWVRIFSITHVDRMTLISSFSHDGAEQDIFAALLTGATLYPFSLKRGQSAGSFELSEFLVKEKLTLWHSVPSLYHYFVNSLTGIEKFPLLRFIVLGGEPVLEYHITMFQKYFPHSTLANVYGQSESSVNSIWLVRPDEPAGHVVIGKALDCTKIFLINDFGKEAKPLETGEIVVASPHVSPGYWRNEDASKKVFTKDPKFGMLYWTGDLGCLLLNGEIEFIGRRDTQVKIRGYRIELGEIETLLLRHPSIKEAVVTAKKDAAGEWFLVAYIITRATAEFEPTVQQPVTAWREYLAQELPDYMIPAYFVQMERFPLTTSNKIDRKALPDPEIGNVKDYLPPTNETERRLTQIWSEVLAVAVDKIGIQTNFFELGGHSLKVAALTFRIHKEFNAKVPLDEVFKRSTIKELALYIQAVEKELYLAVEPCEKKHFYPLSSAQKRLFFLQMMEETGTMYNMSQVLELAGNMALERLQATFAKLIQRHESFRTSFLMVAEEPVQRVFDHVTFAIEYQYLSPEDAVEDIIKAFIRPFDLSQAPLLRVAVVRVAENSHLLMVDMHHIISDGTSMGLLIKEFMDLYEARHLHDIGLHYKDYAVWETQRKAEILKQEAYWLQEFAEEIPVLELPLDYIRPQFQQFAGKSLSFNLDNSITRGANALALQRGATLYMVLLAAYTIFLAKVSNQDVVVVGTPTAGRRHADLEEIIGMFVNTLVLKNEPVGEKSMVSFLDEVKEKTLTVFANQDYQYEELVEKVMKYRDTSRNPLFDTMFVLQNMDAPTIENPELKLRPFRYQRNIAKFDLTLQCVEMNDSLSCVFEYNTGLFKQDTIQRFIYYFQQVLSSVLENPIQKIAAIEIISASEKEQILLNFNATEADYPKDKTIHQLFSEQAARTPDNIAIIGPTSTGCQLTYAALNTQSTQLAGMLIKKGVLPDTIVAIMVARSIEMIIGILGILKAGGAYLPIDPDYPEDRKQFILSDSAATILLTHHLIQDLTPILPILPIIPITPILPIPPITPTNLAYVIYTSGSTGTPKGVLIEHTAAVNVLWAMQRDYPLCAADAYLLKTSYIFDVSVSECFGWYMAGGRGVLLEKGAEKDPDIIMATMARHHISHINFVPSMFNVFIEQLTQHNKRCLAPLKYIFLAGEVLLPRVVEKFSAFNSTIKLENIYGPTEATVYSSQYSLTAWHGTGPIPIGKPLPNVQLYIVGQNDLLQPIAIPGELCIAGTGLARGYLNRPTLTHQQFSPSFHHAHTAKILYRTGDLARWLPDGNIEFLGRLDHQVKIRGFRIELGEIENTLFTHPKIKEVFLIAGKSDSGDSYLCAYFVTKEPVAIESSELREYLALRLPDYMIPAYFVPLEHMPLTANGKVNRRALPEPEIQMQGGYTAPRTPIELKLVEIWSLLLGLKKEIIGIHDNFFELGGHSLKATTMMSRIHKALDIKIELAQLFKNSTIASLAKLIEKTVATRYTQIEPVEKKEYYPVSSAQKRLYFLQILDETSIGYNMPQVIKLEGTIHREKLTTSFNMLIQRHESFRTAFFMVGEHPVQRVYDHVPFEIGQSVAQLSQIYQFIRPFDLAVAPLLRVEWVQVAEAESLLIVDMHHIIADGISMGVLVNDFMAIYEARELPELRLHYKDYAQWENNRHADLTQQEAYWLHEFKGEVPVLDLPLDYVRPKVKGFAGSNITFFLDSASTRALNTLALQHGSTLYMILLTVYSLFLAKICNQETVVVGTPTAGRSHADLEQVIGMFVNTLVLKNEPAGKKSVSAFLKEVRDKTLNGFANQDYQYEELVEKIVQHRDTSRNPLFDTMFVLQNLDVPSIENSSLSLKSHPFASRTAKFDLTLVCIENEQQLACALEYSTALFKQETIQKFSQYFQAVISAVLKNPTQKIADIEIISCQEKEQILFNFNNTASEYPQDKTIHQLFMEQSDRTPSHMALIGPKNQGCQLTYQELNQKSTQLAHQLIAQGVIPNTIVAIMVERSLEMIIGILGILKSGAAYLPIDPDYPTERKQFMLTDSAASILLTQQFIQDPTPITPITPIPPITPTTLAYLIYTSGSTGKPKGVMVEHRSIFNTITYRQQMYKMGSTERALQLFSFAFDGFLTSFFTPIVSGTTVVLLSGEEVKDIACIAEIIATFHITHFICVPSLFRWLLETTTATELSCLKVVTLAGEQVLPDLVEKSKQFLPWLALVNEYGPTESSVLATIHPNIQSDPVISIGTPIANTRAYILDQDNHLVPIGIPGQLVLSGQGLARGYLNNPELTHHKFFSLSISSTSSTKCYQTGDLARWLPDGRIQFLGRIDQQVKIRGFRIEPGEIEALLRTHSHIKDVVVVVTGEEHGDKTLAAYFVADSPVIGVALREYLLTRVPEYMIPSFFVPVEKIPRTLSGKVDRTALPALEIKLIDAYIAPRNPIEKNLAALWSEILHKNPLQEPIGINDNFFQLGGHSLKATFLASRIHKAFNVKVPLAQIFKDPTINALSQYIIAASGEKYSHILPVEEKEYYPLSSAQKRLFFLQLMDKKATVYNISSIWSLAGRIDKSWLEQCVSQLIFRHQSFRTSFHFINDEPVQRIQDSVSFEIEDNVHVDFIFVRPFDLAKAPLLRIRLETLAENEHLLLVDMHHIIADGQSMEILIQEFATLFASTPLPPLTLQYKDYAAWQSSEKESQHLKQQELFWLHEFAGEIPLLDLPTNFVRPSVQSFAGDNIHFKLTPSLVASLKEIVVEAGATLYIVLLACYTIFLAKISNQEDIVVGTPIAGRRHVDLENIIGMFVNTMAIRNYPVAQKNCLAFMREVRDRTLNVFDNQEYQYEDLVEKVTTARALSRNPLFDTMFVLQNLDSQTIATPGLQFVPCVQENKTSKFDLSLTAVEAGEIIAFKFEYNSQLFTPDTIQRFSTYFINTLSAIVEDKNRAIATIELIPIAEKSQLLYDFNTTTADYPADKTIPQLFMAQAERTPDSIALIGPNNSACQLTYAALNKKSHQLAQVLIEKGIIPDTIVAIMVERSLEMIIGILGILISGGAYLPIAPALPEDRKQFMLADSNAQLLLTHPFIQDSTPITPIIPILPILPILPIIPILPITPIIPTNLAYILYTSGTSGKPKGVMVTHQNVVNVVSWFGSHYLVDSHTRIILMSDYSFDASVNQIFAPLFLGASLYVLEKTALTDIHALRLIIRKQRINLINFVPALLRELLCHKAKLPSLHTVISGAENLDESTKNNILELGYQLYNQYGPTECTIDALVLTCSQAPVSLGKPISNVKIRILDKFAHIVPIGISGELFISGLGVTRGYLNNPELTAQKFITSPDGTVLFKTGDLTRWWPDGNVEFLGRIDTQVKIRGFRIELEEIENQLLTHPEIKEAVLSAIDNTGSDTYLCAYIVKQAENAPLDTVLLREYLSQRLPDYMIPFSFVQLAHIPRTANGKINRAALPKPDVCLTHEYVAPADNIQEKLAAIWAAILKKEPHKIGIEDNFFELGGHSLRATMMLSKVHQEFDVEVSLEGFFKNPRISHMSAYIKNAQKSIFESIQPVELKEYYPQSSAQKRLFFLGQLENIGATYNMPMTLILEEKIDQLKFTTALKALISRHETLRTSFSLIGNDPIQRVHDTVDFKIEEVTTAFRSIEEIVRAFIRPFDLAQPPLLRFGIGQLPDDTTLLLFDIHHIISDGTSMGLLLNDFARLFASQELPPLHVQYKDFSMWQNSLFNARRISAQKQYWLDLYADTAGIPKLGLPIDYPRPPVFNFEGDIFKFKISGAQAATFKRVCLEHNVTTFMYLLAVYSVLLFKYTGQEDVIIGCDIAGRPHADLQAIIGMFVNELAMRNHPQGSTHFDEFLNEVKKTSIRAFENQDYQFEELVDNLDITRDASRNPLFDVQFACQNTETSQTPMQGIKLVPYATKNQTAKFDLALDVFEGDHELGFRFQYCTKLFKKSTIQAMSGHFLNILSHVLEKPRTRLHHITMMAESEKHQILFEFNNTKKEVVRDACFTALFEQQVAKTPDRIAVCYQHESLSYHQLNQHANRLANYLRYEKNIRPNDLIGIWMHRSIYFLISILGIMKAGAAYIPIETTLPDERVKKIIDNAKIGLVITTQKYEQHVNRLQWECPSFHSFLLLDGDNSYVIDTEEDINLKSAEELWNYVSETSTDDITEGGWLTSYTGDPFTREEMEEYTDNTLKKLTPLLHQEMRVLEIGCASGLTMYPIAAKVRFYYGTDLSQTTIQKNKQRVLENHYDNIALACLPAHEIDRITEKDFDLVIINSVIQSFQGHNYLRHVLHKVVALLADNAFLYIGDVMDQDLKQDLIQEMVNFKRANKGKNYKTKVDWSQELFISRAFLQDMSVTIPAIQKCEFSHKIYTIPNELTKFRYDALLTIAKTSAQPSQPLQKHKYQDGLSQLQSFHSHGAPTPATPHDLAYVIYTSGSTGQPKGVLIHQLGMINHLYAKINDLAITSEDSIAQTASAGFDISVWQFLAAILVGGTTFIIDKEIVLEPGQFLHVLQQHRVTILETVPSLMAVFLDDVATTPQPELTHLKWMIPTGEPLTPALVRKWYAHFPHIKLLNAYGPTEASDDITHYIVHELPGETQPTIPIGKPLQNLHIYILDANLSLCPVRVRGEICVAGLGVGKGYWQDPVKTAYSFIPNPFSAQINDPDYATLYRTGDIGYFTPDGIVECLGRIDNQVKIRGNRIELEEIENRLLKHPQIKEAVVVVKQKEGMEKALYAYIVCTETENPDTLLNVDQLRDYLGANLPDYMLPSHFVKIDKIPLTPNGKMDRKAMDHMGEVLSSSAEYAPPETELEKMLESIWKQTLKVDRVSIHDDFFELGGNSLTAIAVTSSIKKAGLEASLIDVITNPNFSVQAAAIAAKNKPAQPDEDPTSNEEIQLLGQLECIEKLNHGHNKRNIFIVHPQHGMVNQYVPLAILLQKEFNVYGIQARGVNPRTPVSLTPGEMINDYLKQIKAVQKKGPYIIAGHCVGAFIGYELVRRLENSWHKVEKLIFFDHYAFMNERPLKRYRWMKYIPFAKRQYLAQLDDMFKLKKILPANILVGISPDDPNITTEEKNVRKINVSFHINRLGCSVMSPGIIKAPFLMTQAINGIYPDLTVEDFKCMTRGPIEVIKTPGDHDSIFESPYVEDLAKLILAHV